MEGRKKIHWNNLIKNKQQKLIKFDDSFQILNIKACKWKEQAGKVIGEQEEGGGKKEVRVMAKWKCILCFMVVEKIA